MNRLKQKQHDCDQELPDYDILKLEPIVALDTGRHRHYEILSKYRPTDQEGWFKFYNDFYRTIKSANVDFRFAFNVDSDHIADESIFAVVLKIAALSKCIAVEWTEAPSNFGVPVDEVAERLSHLRASTMTEIHLDDVGSGEDPMVRASLVSPDVIKIDGELFHRARNSRQAADLIQSHIACYQAGFAEIVIEWIENDADLKLAKMLGADFGQGYHFKDRFLKVVR